jgi:hypothetical protein
MKELEQTTITKYDLLYEQRMTRVETTLENLGGYIKEVSRDMKSDFRWIIGIMLAGFGVLLGTFAALFGLMAHGFKWF